MDILALWSGLLFGLFGSIHCAGMCGPIALSLPGGGSPLKKLITGRLLYNFGRVVTYCILGLIAGLIGTGFEMGGIQGLVSVVTGVILVLIAVVPQLSFEKIMHRLPLRFPVWMSKKFANLIKSPSPIAMTFLGILNGFLPCGFVYIALIGSIGMDGLLSSIVFMAMFGLGTIPVMLLVSLAPGLLAENTKRTLSKAFPYLIALVGILLILRGLSLGIPMISPASMHDGHGIQHMY